MLNPILQTYVRYQRLYVTGLLPSHTCCTHTSHPIILCGPCHFLLLIALFIMCVVINTLFLFFLNSQKGSTVMQPIRFHKNNSLRYINGLWFPNLGAGPPYGAWSYWGGGAEGQINSNFNRISILFICPWRRKLHSLVIELFCSVVKAVYSVFKSFIKRFYSYQTKLFF